MYKKISAIILLSSSLMTAVTIANTNPETASASTNTYYYAKNRLESSIFAKQTTTEPDQQGGYIDYTFKTRMSIENPTVYIKVPNNVDINSVELNNETIQPEDYTLDGDHVLKITTEANYTNLTIRVNVTNNETTEYDTTYAFIQSDSLENIDTTDMSYEESFGSKQHTFMHILGAFEQRMNTMIGTRASSGWTVKHEPVDSDSLGYFQFDGILTDGKNTESLSNTTQWIGTQLTVEKYTDEDGDTYYNAPDLFSIIDSFKDSSDGYDINYTFDQYSGLLTLQYTIKDSTLNENEFVENTDGSTQTLLAKFNELNHKNMHLKSKTNTVTIDLAKYYDHIKQEKSQNPDATEFSQPLTDVVKVNGKAKSFNPGSENDYKINLTWTLK